MSNKKRNITEEARIPYGDVPNSELFGDNRMGAEVHVSRLPSKKRPNDKPKEKKRIIERDGNKCLRCGSTEDLTVDHIVPLSKGGHKYSQHNRQTLCSLCNLWKGDMTIDYRDGIPVPDPINEKISEAKRRVLRRNPVKRVYKHSVEIKQDQ